MTLTAVVRTVAQAVASWAIGFAWVSQVTDSVQLEALIYMVLLALVTGVVNWVGNRWPWINKIFSLGLSDQSASYGG